MRLLVAGLFCVVLVGCRADGSRSSTSQSGAAEDSQICSSPTDGFGLINGRVTSQFKSVVLLGAIKKVGSAYKRSTCTGTFVGANVIATAAHCLDGTATGGLVYIPGDRFETVKDFMSGISRGIQPARAIFGSKYGESLDPNKPDDRRQDFAFLIMNGNIAPAVTPLLDHRPSQDDATTMVGFGALSIEHPEESLAVTKRYGYNRVSLTYPGILGGGLFLAGRALESAANKAAGDSMSAPGDSGGPLFVDGAVAGVTTGGFLDPTDSSKAVAVFLDANNEESLSLIDRAKSAGAQITRAPKGPIQSAPFISQSGACPNSNTNSASL